MTCKIISIECYKKFGASRQALREALYKKKHVPFEFQECLASYKLLVWSKELLQHKLAEGSEHHTVTRFNKTYQVVWDSIDSRGYFLREPLDSEWFLSFREPAPEFNLPNVVYITRKY